MGAQFLQVDGNTFSGKIPGVLPTAADRAKFMKPKVENKDMSKDAIIVELVQTIKSVLDTARADHGLEILHTLYQNATADLGTPEDTVNHVGIYPTTKMAQRATHLTKKDILKSTLTEDDLNQGSLGRCSWYWLSVLGEVRSLSSKLCGFYMNHSSPQPPQDEAVPIEASSSDDPPACASPSHASASHAAISSTSAASPEVGVEDLYIINQMPGGEQGLDRLSDHMFKLFTHQHRLFAYGFYVQWKWARLLYFDRTGILVSEPFDWTETTSLLHDFVWKVAHMTPEQLGYDPTAQLASESDIEKLREKMQDQSLPAEVRQYVQKAFLCKATQPGQETPTNLRNSNTDELDEPPLDDLPVYRLTVTSSDPSPDEAFSATPAPSPSNAPSSESGARVAVERTRAFLVGRPHFAADSLVGRCTRGYIAFDLQDDIFCFLKDSWRPLTSRRFGPEHLVYERLHHHKVVHIASLICGGNVGGHRAQVTCIQEDMPPEKKPTPRVHYRIVVKEIGMPLTEFKTFTELAMIFGHALLAHMTAWEYAGILHHDINLGNILIDPVSRSGILIDWDLSRLASELEDGPVEPDRTGTWQFRSALVLHYPRKPYRLSDDIESFIHAFRYMVLRFHRTDIPGLRSHVESYFEHSIRVGNVRLGGQSKMDYFRSKQSSFDVVNNGGLQALLDTIASRCHHEYYKLIDKNLMERKYGLPRRQTGVPQRSTPPVEPAPSRRPPSATVQAMLDRIRHRICIKDTPPSYSRPQVASKVDACDIKEGFLSHQVHLLALMADFQSGLLDKHEDQFLARASEEPMRTDYRDLIRGSSDPSTSSSESQDSTQNSNVSSSVEMMASPPQQASPAHPALVCSSARSAVSPTCGVLSPADFLGTTAGASPDAGPSAASSTGTSPQVSRKRKQKDVQAVEDTVADGDHGHGEGPLSSNPKRQRTARS